MRIGFITDMHLGFTRGTKVDAQGVNIREQDFIDAARRAVRHLIEAKVDVIVDGGDMAEVAAPKKRAVLSLIHLIRGSGLPWYSANGNHTLQRTRSDLHLYDVLGSMCDNFHGYTAPTFVEEVNGLFVPYTTNDEIREALQSLRGEHPDADFLIGHWSANDVPYPGDHVEVSDLPVGIPTFLGHYHRRQVGDDDPNALHVYEFSKDSLRDKVAPIYLGSTERSKWNEWDNPTGVGVWDTETGLFEFIEHEARPWIDLHATAEDYMEVVDRDLEGAIVRLTIDASREQYASRDEVGLKKKVRGLNPLEFEVRRKSRREAAAGTEEEVTFSLNNDWDNHIKHARLARGIDRELVKRIGAEALAMAGGLAA